MARFGVGQSVTRIEDWRFLSGQGRFLDDLALSGIAYAHMLRAPHAHALIRSIDASKARAAPGVLAVLTGGDLDADAIGSIPPLGIPPGWGGAGAFLTAWPPLVKDRCRYVGEVVAVVVAETPHLAQDAAGIVAVDYEPLSAVVSVGEAAKDGAPPVWDDAPGNQSFQFELGDKAAAQAAFANAAHVTTFSAVNNRISANPMEPRGAIGEYSATDGRYTLHSTNQAPFRLREQLAEAVFKLPEHRIRVVSYDVGGGFGMKATAHPEDVLVLWAARKVGRPVKWIAERTESLVSDMHARDQVWHAEMAFDPNARIVAVRARGDFNMGAYASNSAIVPPMIASGVLSSVYDCPDYDVTITGYLANCTPTGPYRGAGHPEGTYLIERLLDRAAVELGIETRELHRRNFIRPDQMPYRTGLEYTYDCGEFEAAMDKSVDLAAWDGFADRRAESERAGRLRGIGLSYFIELTSPFNERMEVRFDPSGALTIVSGAFSHGQGHETVYAQMASEWLGVPFETIRLVQGDTDQVPMGRGTFASRSMVTGGSALRAAADDAIEKGKRLAAHFLEAAEEDIEFTDGTFTVTGTDRSIDIVDVAKASYALVGLPPDLGLGLDGTGVFTPVERNFPNGCHICEVEVDPETGDVGIERYAAVDDVGRAINPLLLKGQVHGGVTQGIGQALMEKVTFDESSGQMLSASFMDYCMPRADDLSDFDIGSHDVPTAGNPLGVKGAGEAGTTGATPAVVNAVLDALRPLGVEDLSMPLTPLSVWGAIEAAQAPAT